MARAWARAPDRCTRPFVSVAEDLVPGCGWHAGADPYARRQGGARLSLADCCCLATGIRLDLPVVTGDQTWQALRLGVEVLPLR